MWIDAFDLQPKDRDEDTHLKSFHVRFVPGGGQASKEWILNESYQESNSRYISMSLEHDRRTTASSQRADVTDGELLGPHDPTVADVQKTADLLEECWQLYTSGDHHAIYWWGGKK